MSLNRAAASALVVVLTAGTAAIAAAPASQAAPCTFHAYADSVHINGSTTTG